MLKSRRHTSAQSRQQFWPASKLEIQACSASETPLSIMQGSASRVVYWLLLLYLIVVLVVVAVVYRSKVESDGCC